MKNTLYLFLLFSFLFSCKSIPYHQTQAIAIDNLASKKYDLALAEMNKNKELNQQYNLMLKQVEEGRVLFLQGNYSAANKLFIEAELKVEDFNSYFYRDISGGKIKVFDFNNEYYSGKVTTEKPKSMGLDWREAPKSSGYSYTGSLKTASRTEYICLDMEKPLLNFYVGLSAAYGNKDNFLVEAKRLEKIGENLDRRAYPINPEVPYARNPFTNLAAGLFYEAAGEPNDALIAYEKAWQCYQDYYSQPYYGMVAPEQLKLDILRINKKLGFTDKYEQWSKQFSLSLKQDELYSRSLVLIIEEGLIPFKNPTGNFQIQNKPNSNSHNLPTTSSVRSFDDQTPTFPEYLPAYSVQYYPYTNRVKSIQVDQTKYEPQLINNLEFMMVYGYGKRNFRERVYPVSTGNGFDLRHWQTLPNKIYYVRIPLKKDESTLKFSYTVGRQIRNVEYTLDLNKQMQIRHIYVCE